MDPNMQNPAFCLWRNHVLSLGAQRTPVINCSLNFEKFRVSEAKDMAVSTWLNCIRPNSGFLRGLWSHCYVATGPFQQLSKYSQQLITSRNNKKKLRKTVVLTYLSPYFKCLVSHLPGTAVFFLSSDIYTLASPQPRPHSPLRGERSGYDLPST